MVVWGRMVAVGGEGEEGMVVFGGEEGVKVGSWAAAEAEAG